jgi:hypothetical protein
MSAARQDAMPRPSWRMLPGGELSDVLDGLDVHDRVRDLLCFVAGRDPETFARAVGYAAPEVLPDRLREAAL